MNPPNTPTVIPFRTVSESSHRSSVNPITAPSRNAPTRFATTVPAPRNPTTSVTTDDSAYRDTAPTAPPAATASTIATGPHLPRGAPNSPSLAAADPAHNPTQPEPRPNPSRGVPPPVTPLPLDHLVYVTADLDRTIDHLHQRLGVRPAGGGSHTGRGTRNALLSLGPDCYLELLAPDPHQQPQQPASRFPASPLLRTRAVKAPAIDATVATARRRGYDPGDVQAMSRARPDGILLEWRLTARAGGGLGATPTVDPIPFLIDWGPSEHPALTAPAGCTLRSLRAEHPDPGALQPTLHALDVTLDVTPGPTPALIATIDSPNGPLELR